METFDLAPGYTISRVIKGGWQLATGHGAKAAQGDARLADMAAFFDAGITTFDCADIYTGVEESIGDFRRDLANRRGAAALARLRVHTKCVPDLAALATIDRATLTAGIDRSLLRLGMERLDLVQFHWWDYRVDRWAEVGTWLAELQTAGKIHLLGATNFDQPRLRGFAEAGVRFATLQAQYSVLDARPAGPFTRTCGELGTQLLCFGTVAGGFLSERWLGAPEPAPPFENRSLVKYALIIAEFGGWALFQDLLATLKRVGDRHGAGIGTVASRWALDQPGVAGVIVGARTAEHLAENLRIAALRLSAEDHAQIDAVRARRAGPAGDVYGLERDIDGRHGSIMKYDLNTAGH